MNDDRVDPQSHSLDDIVADYADRLSGGEQIEPEEILSEHPTLCGEILDQLGAFVSVGLPVPSENIMTRDIETPRARGWEFQDSLDDFKMTDSRQSHEFN